MTTLNILNELFSNNFNYEILTLLSMSSTLCGVFIISSKNPIVSVLFLIGLFLIIASYLMMAGINFIGLSYLLVYVGAVSILLVFLLIVFGLFKYKFIHRIDNIFVRSCVVFLCTVLFLPLKLLFIDLSLYGQIYLIVGLQAVCLLFMLSLLNNNKPNKLSYVYCFIVAVSICFFNLYILGNFILPHIRIILEISHVLVPFIVGLFINLFEYNIIGFSITDYNFASTPGEGLMPSSSDSAYPSDKDPDVLPSSRGINTTSYPKLADSILNLCVQKSSYLNIPYTNVTLGQLGIQRPTIESDMIMRALKFFPDEDEEWDDYVIGTKDRLKKISKYKK